MTVEHLTSAATERAAPFVAKLLAPPLRAGLVRRPQLELRLNAVSSTPVTILSAPAGFGKTTLLSAWLANSARRARPAGSPQGDEQAPALRVAWLTLDAEDSDPARFWPYLLAALSRAVPELPAELVAALQARPLPADVAAAGLANAIAALPHEIVLILDDYHTITGLAVHRSLAALVEHCPPGLHLVIAGRADPPLPLARLRARGQLNELRAVDLRFSREESRAFLRGTMGLDLSRAAIEALDTSAEGWPAGLQLAALWLRDHPEPAGGVAALAGTERYLITFLAEEVIERQPPELQRFLLDTAILDRWCPELCDYLTADARHAEAECPPVIVRPAQQIIANLEQHNLFVVALDTGAGWYRYHTLFGDALRHELARRRGPGAVARLHARAAAWFAAASVESPALLELALHHAIAGHCYDLAADLIVPRFEQLSAEGRSDLLLAWLTALPPAVLSARPALALRYAWVLFLDGHQDEARRWLQDGEAGLAASVAPDPLTLALPHLLRAAMATNGHDDLASLHHAEQAAALLPADAPFWTAMLTVARGLAHLVRGDAREAAAALQHAADLAVLAASDYGGLVSNWHLGRTRLLMGRPQEAAQAFARIGAGGDPRSAGYREVGLALVAYERNERTVAREGARRGLKALEAAAGQPRVMIAALGLLARIARDAGEQAEAGTMLDRAELLARRLGLQEELAELLALRATFAVEDGDLAAAGEWAAGIARDGAAPDVRREGELLALARVLAARGDRTALDLAGALCAAATAQGRLHSVIVCRLVCASAHRAVGQHSAADAARASAGQLAASTGLIRFAAECAPADLAPGQRKTPLSPLGNHRLAQLAHAAPVADSWCEELSQRELRVLALIAAGCSNHEIASTLIVSVNTIKTHIKRIYEKLQVNSRVSAVERARELGLYR